MMKKTSLIILSGLLTFAAGSSMGQINFVTDNYTAVNVGSGFALNNGINSGINPPTALG